MLYDVVGEERIFEHYLGIVPILGRSFTNPLRIDRNPGCTFSKNAGGRLYFWDWALGRSFGAIDVVIERTGLGFRDALLHVARTFDVPVYGEDRKLGTSAPKAALQGKARKLGPIKKQDKRYDMKFHRWGKEYLEFWAGYGIDRRTLEKFRVRPLKWLRLNDNVIYTYHQGCPAYAYLFPEGPKFYFPHRKQFRFMGRPVIQKGPLKGTGTLWVTKSYKDVMVLHQFGLDAMAPPSESWVFDDEPEEARMRRVIVNGDNDPTGRAFMERHAEKYDWTPWTIRDPRAKDLSDYLKIYGKKELRKILP